MGNAIMMNSAFGNYQVYTASNEIRDFYPNIITAIETELGISDVKRVVNLGTPQNGVYFVSVIEKDVAAYRKNASDDWGAASTGTRLLINQGESFLIIT